MSVSTIEQKSYLPKYRPIDKLHIMTTVLEIEKAVAHLPQPDLEKFREWFNHFDANAWDQEFEADAQCGALDRLAEQALSDLDKGLCTDL